MAAYVKHARENVLPSSANDISSCQIQTATHQDIIALGHEIFTRNARDTHFGFENDLRVLQDKLEEQALAQKKEAVDIAQMKAEQQLQDALEDANRRQEKAVRSESKRVEAVMKKLAKHQVEEERLRGEQMLEDSLTSARNKFDEEKANAIKATRMEEQSKAGEELAALQLKHAKELDKLRCTMTSEKEGALENLRRTLDEEKKIALNDLQKTNNREKEEELASLREQHSEQLSKLEETIENYKIETNRLENNIKKQISIRCQKIEKLKEVVQAFQLFIEQQPGFVPGQCEYILKDFLTDTEDEDFELVA